MKKLNYFLLISQIVLSITVFAQKGDLILSFEGKDVTTNMPVPLQSVNIQNLSQICDTTIYGGEPFIFLSWPSAIDELSFGNNHGIELMPNYPNPFISRTKFALSLKNAEPIRIMLYDMYGKIVSKFEDELPFGLHSFELFISSPGFYCLIVSNGVNTKTI